MTRPLRFRADRRPVAATLAFVLGFATIAPTAAAQGPAAPAASAASAAPATAPAATPPTATPPVAPAPAAAAPATDGPPKPLAESLTGDAKVDYDSGKVLYGDGDFRGALVKFQSAYAKSKDPRLLWNAAACEKNLRHYAKVAALVRRYLAEGATILTSDERSRASDLLDTLKPLVANLKLDVDQSGAQVAVDDEPVGATPLPALTVDLGPRHVKITKDGFREVTRTIDVSGNADLLITFHLEKDVHEGRLAIHAGAHDAISVDGSNVGIGSWSGTLASGGHSVRVTAPGMRAYQSEVLVQDNQGRSVDVTLDPEPQPTVAAPKEGGSSAWIWVVGGTLLAGAAVGGYFLFKPKDDHAPVAGTIGSGTVQLPLKL